VLSGYPCGRQSQGRVVTGVYLSVCLSVCLSVYPHDILETAIAIITSLDIEMVHHESWKPIYFCIKRSKVKVLKHENSADVGLCTLVSAGFFQVLLYLLTTRGSAVTEKPRGGFSRLNSKAAQVTVL